MEEHEWDKCWAVNVKGQMALVREALPTFNANPEGGVFLITSSVAVRLLQNQQALSSVD
ncbi:MAG: hypothetical protein Q9157_005566 [Trypethelium eluteriae]